MIAKIEASIVCQVSLAKDRRAVVLSGSRRGGDTARSEFRTTMGRGPFCATSALLRPSYSLIGRLLLIDTPTRTRVIAWRRLTGDYTSPKILFKRDIASLVSKLRSAKEGVA